MRHDFTPDLAVWLEGPVLNSNKSWDVSNSLFFDKLKLKRQIKHILIKYNEKYLYSSFQINLKWAKIESKTTASILKIIIFKDFKLKKLTKLLSQISIFSD